MSDTDIRRVYLGVNIYARMNQVEHEHVVKFSLNLNVPEEMIIPFFQNYMNISFVANTNDGFPAELS